MCSRFRLLLPLVSLPVVCYFEKIGVNRSSHLAMGLKGLSHTVLDPSS